MTIPIPVLVVVSLIVSARTQLHAVIFGQPVSMSGLDLIALAVVLTLVAVILWIIRTILRDGLQLRPAWTGGTG